MWTRQRRRRRATRRCNATRRVGKGATRRAHLTPPRATRQMPRYRRVKIEGGLFFFTLALADRSSDLLVRHIERARRASRGSAGAPVRSKLWPSASSPTICMRCGSSRRATPTTRRAGVCSNPFFRVASRRRRNVPRARSPSARRAFGSGDIGSTPSVTMPTPSGMSTTSTTIRSNTAS